MLSSFFLESFPANGIALTMQNDIEEEVCRDGTRAISARSR